MDRLSQLPEDVLVHIWSFLTTEEAYRTGLSDHWLLYVDTLDLNTSSFITNPRDLLFTKNPNLPALTNRFYEWLEKVAQDRDRDRHLAPLSKLSIRSPLILQKGWLKQIDEWVSYASARKVRSLELEFSYCFTAEHKLSSWYVYRFSPETECLSRLTSLSLSGGVGLPKEEDVDSFLLKCPLLQRIRFCDMWLSPSIRVTSSSLKHLDISHCLGPRVILRNTCLVSLTLTTLDNLFLENNPQLVSVCVPTHYHSDGLKLRQLQSCLSGLQNLTLHLGYVQVYDEIPLLKELKHLTLVVAPSKKQQVAHLTPLLNISPNLDKLVLDLVSPKCYGKRKYKKVPKVSLMHLQDIEVRGYWGEKAEDHLVSYVLDYVLAPITRIIFDPHTLGRNSFALFEEIENKSDQMRADLLKRVIPSTLEFIVL